MLQVRELQKLASSLKLEAFQKQMGPFVLIQRPPEAQHGKQTDLLGLPMNVQSTTMARPGAVSSGTLGLLFQFDTLVVATLPPLEGIDELSVGRQPDCELVIDDKSVSKKHATLRWDARQGRATIQDLGSTNGTFLNASIRLRKEKESLLQDGDIISFGEVQFWYLLTATLHAKLSKERRGPMPRGV
ncbi:MAG: hypothetical protein H6Q89_259 [Myxococcaceae bacterium]|nr:hypothetical protein [Myxococcaceae bacterium]